MSIQSKFINSRLKTLINLLCCFLCIIIMRLFYLQVTQMLIFWNRCQKNCLRYQKIESLRGNILDVKGNLLATNKPITDVYWKGTGKKNLQEDQLAELNLLEQISGKVLDLEEIKKIERISKRVLILHDLNLEQLSRLVEQCPQRINLDLETHFKRYYPHAKLASHIVGYLSSLEEEHKGKMGLEKALEEQLHGDPGERVYTINSCGKYLAQKETRSAHAGHDIYTTIDLSLQQLAEAAYFMEDAGVFTIMDPRSGAIKALVSRPGFDPNIFLSPLSHEQWQSLQDKKPFLNRACNACYPPASLFKMVTIAAGLELGIIQQNSHSHCSGKFIFANRPYHCNNLKGHGTLNIQEAIMHSCNIPFYEIGKKIKIDTLADYANRFGLGIKTNILFAEKSGLIPTNLWKKQIKKESWWPGETLSVAIGQSYLGVTPIQVLCMISSICEGYLVKPRILIDELIEQKPLNISQTTLEFLKKSMKTVVTGKGTARALNVTQNLEIYAKTGTAQTSDLSKRELGKQFVEHAWVLVHFKYKNNDPLALVILLENVGGSKIAVDVARVFLNNYCSIMDKESLAQNSDQNFDQSKQN